MQIRIFTLPLFPDTQQMEEFNLFLRANRIIDVRKEIVTHEGSSFWSFCVTFMPDAKSAIQRGGNKIDYKEILDKESFERFSLMRNARREVSKEEGVPAYFVFTDAELAELSTSEELTRDVMLSVPGIGQKRTEKYFDKFLEMLKREKDEALRKSDRKDSGVE